MRPLHPPGRSGPRPGAGPPHPRELEILRLVAAWTPNRRIAEELFISEATVKTHLIHAYGKLGVKDRAAAVATAYERGLLVVTPPS